ncbi:unnamed protein product [Lampetra planeri]
MQSAFRCPVASCQLLLLLSPLLLLASAASIGKQGTPKQAACSDLTHDLTQLLKANRELVQYIKSISTSHENEWIFLQYQLVHFYAEVFSHINKHEYKSEAVEKGKEAFLQLNSKFTKDPYAECKSPPKLNTTAKNCSRNIQKGINDLKSTHLKREVINKALNEIEILENILNVKSKTGKPKAPGNPKDKPKSGKKNGKKGKNRRVR